MSFLASVRAWLAKRRLRRREEYLDEGRFAAEESGALSDEREQLGLDRNYFRGPQDVLPPSGF
jgi:hypothetical protein